MNQSLFIGLTSALLLLIIAGTFLFLHLKNLQQEALQYWNELNGQMRVRIDKIPLLIEMVRIGTKGKDAGDPEDKIISDLIALRSQTWPLKKVSEEKIAYEQNLSGLLHDLLERTQNNPDLQHNVTFIAVAQELRGLAKEIAMKTADYNQRIDRFNHEVMFFMLRPFTMLAGFRKLPAFKFEA